MYLLQNAGKNVFDKSKWLRQWSIFATFFRSYVAFTHYIIFANDLAGDAVLGLSLKDNDCLYTL